MEVGALNKSEAEAAVRFLKTIATVGHTKPLSPLESTCIHALQKNIYLTDFKEYDILEISKKDLESAIQGDNKRLELVRAAMFIIAAESHIDDDKTELLKDFASYLNVTEADLDGLEEIAEGHMEMATLDFMRRKAHPEYSLTDPKIEKLLNDNSLASLWKYLMPYTEAKCEQDLELANKYKSLKNNPKNTVGWHLYNYYDENKFNFPGEIAGDNPEFPMIIHDLSHVLGNYKPTPEEEMEVLAFTAGYRHGRGFDAVFQAIVHFHLGLKIDPAFQPYDDKFEPEPFFAALRRGNDMNIDLFKDWDYWSIMDRDLDELRKEYNVVPK